MERKKYKEYKMGTTSAKVSDRFNFLATFPYLNPTKNDIKRLDRRVNKALCRIKCMGLSSKLTKNLLKRGFTSEQLLSWLNKLIDENINYKNMVAFTRLATLFKNKLQGMEYIEPLHLLYQKYRDFVAKGMKLEASTIVYKTSLIVAPLVIYLEGEQSKQDGEEFSSQILLKVDDSLVSLESSYINDNFSNEVRNGPPGSTLVTGLGLLSDSESQTPRPYKVYGYEKYFDDGRYIYIPKIYNGVTLYAYVYFDTIITSSDELYLENYIPLQEYVDRHYNILVKDVNWYKIDAYPAGELQYIIASIGDDNIYSPFGLPVYSNYISLFNNTQGFKVEDNDFIYYTSQPLSEFPEGSTVTSYAVLLELQEAPLGGIVTILNPNEGSDFNVIGPYGYLFFKSSTFDRQKYRYWMDFFLKRQNMYPIPSA